MQGIEIVAKLLNGIWVSPIFEKIIFMKIDVNEYPELKSKIPDNMILIQEIFPKDELEHIFCNFKPYLEGRNICPFLGTLGEAVICIGFDQKNKGKIFYFDLDFGCFQLGNDNLTEFLSKLIE